MKKIYLFSLLTAMLAGMAFSSKAQEPSKRVNIFDHVVFYDGYQPVVVDADVDDGVIRFKNSLYSVKLPMDQLQDIGDNLKMEVVIGALCDNYDRIGNVDIAFVPKGQDKYEYDAVSRIEVTRFITPFMNMNKKPDEVPYDYDIDNVARILRDADINAKYDLWMEMEVFGVPYAANTQIKGCADRNDVFEGTIDLVYTPSETTSPLKGNIIVPIYVKRPEDHGNVNFNNYKEGATDTLGITTRTFEFEVPEDVVDSRIYLILTNHGAATNGEEYVRRLHLVYFDGELVLSYKPGGVSCEPYRQYNTQANGIYSTYRTEKFWENNSNWCPGQAVPIRELNPGALAAGKHKVMIRVPDAVFYGQDGDFRPSLYFHGVTEGELPSGVAEIWFEGPGVSVVKEGNFLDFKADDEITDLFIHSYEGVLLDIIHNPSSSIDISKYGKGAFILTVLTPEGRTTAKQMIF